MNLINSLNTIMFFESLEAFVQSDVQQLKQIRKEPTCFFVSAVHKHFLMYKDMLMKV